MRETHSDLIKTIDRIAEALCPKSVRGSAESGEWPGALWRSLEDVGLTGALAPEADGGSGLDLGVAMLAVRRSAYHALPIPLAETMQASRLLAAAGIAVPRGALSVAPAGMRGEPLKITQTGGVFRLSGSVDRVPWGNQCAMLVVAAEMDSTSMIGLLTLPAELAHVDKNLAGEPRVLLHFKAVPLIAAAPLGHAGRRLLLDGAMFRSVQMAGALERALEYSLQYANERVAFGRSIGKFQAVQQMLAVLAGHAAAASAAADMAVESSPGAPSELAVAIAKARTGEAAGKSAEIAHQVHGAMGFTHEHGLHCITRRLWSWRNEYGNERYWQTYLGHITAAAGAEALWPMITCIPIAAARSG